MLGFEFGAMFIERDVIGSLCCKLGMFGVSLDGPFNVMRDKQVVVNNKILPQSTLC